MSPIDDIHTHVQRLTQPSPHTEPRWGWDKNRNRIIIGHHDTTQPSLINQLRAVAIPGPGEDTTGHTIPDSRPPARIAAVSLLAAITTGVARHLHNTTRRPHPTLEHALHHLVGVASTVDNTTQRDIRGTLRDWVRDAETITRWRNPSRELRAPCLACGRRGTLRAWPDTITARCLACGTQWDPDNIGVLGRHVENHARAEQDRKRERKNSHAA